MFTLTAFAIQRQRLIGGKSQNLYIPAIMADPKELCKAA